MTDKPTRRPLPVTRPSSAARGYDSKWRRERAKYLVANPLCVMCAARGITTAATVVDHITPHNGDLKLLWRRSNWQSLCKPCHDGAKQQLDKSGTLRGCAEDGTPLDPNHPWNRGRT